MSRFKHVFIMGVDGAGSFVKEAETPCFDRIFANGAVTYRALASFPTISAECWGSMILGIGPEIHKLKNETLSQRPYPSDSPYPSLFRRIREAFPDASLGSYCAWFRISDGLIEEGLDVETATAYDTNLAPMICDFIKEKRPTFLFCQFDSVDGAGHKFGYGSEGHLNQINVVDQLIGDVYDTTVKSGLADDTLFIYIADHGGTPFNGTGASHGGWTDAEKYVTFAATGRGVCSGTVGPMNVRDIAAIVLYALGLDLPDFDEEGWTSQVPEGLFEGGNTPAYRDISHLTGAEPRQSNLQHTSTASAD